VAIVTTSVHFAGVLAGVGKGVELLHGQGVDVGSEANTSATCTAINHNIGLGSWMTMRIQIIH
jgi:hypothetical protein